MSPHIINRVTILGTGLIGGSLGLALRKYTTNICISGWDRSEVVREAQSRGAIDEAFSGELAPALQNADLIYIALPIAATIDLLPEISRHAPVRALVTDACSTKVRVTQGGFEESGRWRRYYEMAQKQWQQQLDSLKQFLER